MASMILCLFGFVSFVSASLLFIYFYILSRLSEINQLKQEKEKLAQENQQMMQYFIPTVTANETGNFNIRVSILII